MQRKVAVLFVSFLVLIFGAAACGGGLTQEQAEVLEKQGDTQDQMLKVQQEQQEDIEQLQQDVAQLKQQQPQGDQKGGTTEKAK